MEKNTLPDINREENLKGTGPPTRHNGPLCCGAYPQRNSNHVSLAKALEKKWGYEQN